MRRDLNKLRERETPCWRIKRNRERKFRNPLKLRTESKAAAQLPLTTLFSSEAKHRSERHSSTNQWVAE